MNKVEPEIELSPHAKRRIKEENLEESWVKTCVRQGKRVIEQWVKGEKRYGHTLDLKDGKMAVIWTYKDDKKWVITAYRTKRR